MLTVAPVAVDDLFSVNEDQTLEFDQLLSSATFDPLAAAVLSTGSTWQFLDQIQNSLGDADTYPTDALGRPWNDPDFDTSTSTPESGVWSSGASPLGAGGIEGFTTATGLFGIDAADNGQNLITTYLFRNTFELDAADVAQENGMVRLLCDDGCIVSINGAEVLRRNIPADPIDTETFSDDSSGEQYADIPISLLGAGLIEGTNVIAVEVHQINANSSDIGFDLELSLGTGGTDGFQYADDVFGTNSSFFADGNYLPDGGESGGGLRVWSGFRARAETSGGWSRNFSLSRPSTVDVTLSYRLIFDSNYESNEFGEAVLTIDGTRIGNGANNSLARFSGNGNGGSDDDTLWQTANFSIPLAAGDHTLTVGEFNNRSTTFDEVTTALFDNISVSSGGAGSVLSNDTDGDGDLLTARLVSGPDHGTLDFQADGTFIYTPEADYQGEDLFTYVASDGTNESNLATARITVIPGPNDPPTAVDDPFNTTEDGTLVISNPALGLLSNDTDPESDTLSASLLAAPGNGSVTINTDGTFTYTPQANFFGDDTFTYVAFDGAETSSPATVTISVAPVPDDPIASADQYFAEPGQTISVPAGGGVLANDAEPDLQPLTAELVSDVSDGTLALGADGSFEYTSDAGFSGVDSFTYKAIDSTLSESNVVTVTVTVDAAPIASDDQYDLIEDGQLAVPVASGLLSNDQDAEDDPLTVQAVSLPTDGQLTLNPDGTLLYLPEADFFGIDSFTYRINDGDQDSNIATVTFSVTAVNDRPIAAGDAYDTFENGSLIVAAANGLLSNDTDIDSGLLTAELADTTTSGSLTLSADGSFEYTPEAGFIGDDSFTYRVSDGDLTSTLAVVSLTVQSADRLIVINEIMYHPASENDGEEFIELLNVSTIAVDLSGWQLASGVDFTLPDVTIEAGGSLVVAADPALFAAKYPGVTGVVGPWQGRLSNRGETIELENSFGDRIDRVEYSDQGDWAVRRRQNDSGEAGWVWVAPHDGGGPSLSLINPLLSNNAGQNWTSSADGEGTPGAANAVFQSDSAPLIRDVAHGPAVPTSSDPVTVTARLTDELETGVTGEVLYRTSTLNPGPWLSVPMFDDGAHGDGEAGDGLFGAFLPAQSDNTVVEFYVRSRDEGDNTRTWPAPSDDQGGQGANLVYQVDDTVAALVVGDQPFYRIVMPALEDDQFQNGFNRDSNAQMNATFIATTGAGVEVRYNVGVRVRGASSRNRNPVGLRVNVPRDRPIFGESQINLNTQYTWLQLMGSALFRVSGMAAAEATAVQVRLNNANLASSNAPQYGSYVHLEVINTDFIENHFPQDNSGDAYKKIRPDNKWQFRNGDVGDYLGDGWSKSTNASQNDWSSLDEFLRVMNTASGPTYLDQVKQVFDVDHAVRWFALMTILNSFETNLSNGTDDDYQVYISAEDGLLRLLPHDFDTIFGQGDTPRGPQDSIFPAIDASATGQVMPQLVPFFQNPEVAAAYYGQLQELIDTTFSAEQLNPLLDNLLGGWVPQDGSQGIDDMKQFMADRTAFISSQIPSQFTVSHNLNIVNGFPRTTDPATIALFGTIDSINTRRVVAAGGDMTINPFDGTWASGPTTGQVILPAGSTWRYLDNGSDQGTTWRERAFDDSDWQQGPAQLGYGDDDEATQISFGPDENNKFPTSYFRTSFNVTNPAQFTSLAVRLLRDDGAAVYLNGTEIVRDNLSGGAAFDDFADGDAGSESTFFDFTASASLLVSGVNVIAVEVHQSNPTSSDVSMDLELLGSVIEEGATIGLQPGINRVLVEALGEDDVVLQSEYLDIWYDDGDTTDVSGTLGSDTTWTAAAGPYRITGDLLIPDGVTLTITPGTTVYFTNATGITVAGRLLAEGTETARIRFDRQPGTSAVGDGLSFVNSMGDSRLTNVDLRGVGSLPQAILVDTSQLTIDNMTFDDIVFTGGTGTILEWVRPSLIVRNSLFPAVSVGQAVRGNQLDGDDYLIFDGNRFGPSTSGNDVISITGGARPGPIVQLLNNVFLGGGDDAVHLIDADAHIEGNTFINFQSSGSSDATSNAIVAAKGTTGDGNVPQITVVRNIFSDNENAILLLDGASLRSENNVYYAMTESVVQFDEPSGIANEGPGSGASFLGDIFSNNNQMFAFLDTGPLPTELVIDRSMVSEAFVALGTNNSSEDPRLFVPTTGPTASTAQDAFSLLPGSPAISTGPNGLDRGAQVAGGASISGEPLPQTPLSLATLLIAGPGITDYRYRLDGGAFGVETPVSDPLTLSGLADGPHFVEVIGKNSAGSWQQITAATRSRSWTVEGTFNPLQISEVLAINDSAFQHQGTYPDMVELFNPGGSAIDLGGMTLSDNADNPGKFTFSPGTILAAGQRLVLYADNNPQNTSGIHLGFSLDGQGEGVYLYDSAASGGALLDSVEFGIQLPDLSIGRTDTGGWSLNRPTLGEANEVQSTGPISTLRINEWLADGDRLYKDDRIELYNPDPLPVALGGLYLTDRPQGDVAKHQMAPLSFIAGSGYTVLIADSDTAAGADHLNFHLAASQELIALSDESLELIDIVLFAPQYTDTSQGRSPNGEAGFAFYSPPSFGLANPTITQIITRAIAASDVWKYDNTGTDLGSSWREADFDDSAWASGAGPLGFEDDPLPIPLGTTLPRVTTFPTFYFRRRFQIESLDAIELQLMTLIDDGAVVYLNGQEVLRIGMAAGAVDFNTTANRSVTDATIEGPFDLPTDALVLGDNVLAVELHNAAAASADLVFGAQLDSSAIVTTGELPQALEHLGSLRITELMYKPAGGSDFEFLELQNTSNTPFNIEGIRLTNGIDFTFPEMELAGGEYVVIVKNRLAFESRYGTAINIAGEYDGKLSNGGENVQLTLAAPFDGDILDFTYDDLWYPVTDGSGPSLVVVDPTAETSLWRDPANWRASGLTFGSPGADDPEDGIGPQVADVIVSGDGWTGSFLTQLNINGLGVGGFTLPPDAAPIEPLSWTNVNQVTVVFSEYVIVPEGAFTLSGVNVAQYAPDSFDGSMADRATWSFDQPIGADRLLVAVADSVTDTAGNPLLGNPLLGNPLSGGPFTIRFDTLPGDVNRDGTNDGGDFAAILAGQFSRAGDPSYDLFSDIDGNGWVNVLDLLRMRRRVGMTLPPGEPALPSSEAASIVTRIDTATEGPSFRQAVETNSPLVAEVARLWPGKPISGEIGHGKISSAARLRRPARRVIASLGFHGSRATAADDRTQAADLGQTLPSQRRISMTASLKAQRMASDVAIEQFFGKTLSDD